MEAVLEATVRESRGKNEARRTRAEGRVPAVLYGLTGAGKAEATAISVEPKALTKILHSDAGANTLISLKLAGAGDTRVLVKDYQLDPITHQILHADFYRIAMDKVMRVSVPVQLVGVPAGVKTQGGILEHVMREVEIECLPGDIPGHIDADVTGVELHGVVRIADLPHSGSIKFLGDEDATVAHVTIIKEEAPAEAAEAAPAEPEVAKKGKIETAEAAPAADAKKK